MDVDATFPEFCHRQHYSKYPADGYFHSAGKFYGLCRECYSIEERMWISEWMKHNLIWYDSEKHFKNLNDKHYEIS